MPAAAAAQLRSIPACAGKPRCAAVSRCRRSVHPRVCGETPRQPAHVGAHAGPSPRVRGNLDLRRQLPARIRSIPACAGKPDCAPKWSCVWRVHPRVCGETVTMTRTTPWLMGPSPRVRGNPSFSSTKTSAARSIPACAGKPSPRRGRSPAGRVHPRVCGETVSCAHDHVPGTGPSPRVRGNRRRGRRSSSRAGSIPACAGKPAAATRPVTAWRVHPRVCGETSARDRQPDPRPGPSPRVRGNLLHQLAGHARWGSIPACAGKPGRSAIRGAGTGVHPRVCGETCHSSARTEVTPGPSPRVRGNQEFSVG